MLSILMLFKQMLPILSLVLYAAFVLVTANAMACDKENNTDIVAKMKSYHIQPNCTIKCSLYCEMDGLKIPFHYVPVPDSFLPLSNFSMTPTNQPRPTSCQDVSTILKTKTVTITTYSTVTATNTTTITTASPTPTNNPYKDCKDAKSKGLNQSGVYPIKPDSLDPFDVYCDMDTDGGGWAVLQRRQDGSVNFYRNWNNYAAGFGNLSGEFWLGLDYIHRLTNNGTTNLRIDLEDFSNEKRYATYTTFRVSDAATGYRLTFGKYNGTAGNALAHHNGRYFSTYDRDNDNHSSNCAAWFQGAWWYGSCKDTNLNGRYLRGHYSTFRDGVTWNTWLGEQYSLKFTEMKTR